MATRSFSNPVVLTTKNAEKMFTKLEQQKELKRKKFTDFKLVSDEKSLQEFAQRMRSNKE